MTFTIIQFLHKNTIFIYKRQQKMVYNKYVFNFIKLCCIASFATQLFINGNINICYIGKLIMKHKYFVKGRVHHKYGNCDIMEGHAIIELAEDEVAVGTINHLFIYEILEQSGLIGRFDSLDVNQKFIATLDMVNKL